MDIATGEDIQIDGNIRKKVVALKPGKIGYYDLSMPISIDHNLMFTRILALKEDLFCHQTLKR